MPTIKWIGNSNLEYSYQLVSIEKFFEIIENFFQSQNRSKMVPGNYIFSKEVNDKFYAVYIGETEDILDKLNYRFQTLEDALSKNITHIFLHQSTENQETRLNEVHDIIRAYTHFNPNNTAKWTAAKRIAERFKVSTNILQEQDDLYDILRKNGYVWSGSKFQKINEIHPATRDLEIQIRSCRGNKPSALRLRHDSEKISYMAKKICNILASQLNFYKKSSYMLDPPNSADTYVYLYAHIEDTLQLAYRLIDLIRDYDPYFRLNQFHQREERDGVDQPFIDLRFGFSITDEELELLRLARKIYGPF